MEEFNANNEIDLKRLLGQLKGARDGYFVPPIDLRNKKKSKDAESGFVVTEVAGQERDDSDSDQESKESGIEYTITENEEYGDIPYKTYYAGDVPVSTEARQELADGDFDFTSALGTPLIMPVMLENYQLPNEPIITITGSKKIIKTALTGVNREGTVQRRGTVKELISVNDYQIKISGRIVNEDDPGAYPTSIISKLRNLFETRRALKIKSKITEIFGITHIAIDKVSLPGEPGMHNNQRYEISGFSDEDFRTDLISQA